MAQVLLTKEILERLPAEGATDGLEDPMVQVKLFCPWGQWTFYMTEFNPDTRIAYGVVYLFEREFGPVDMNEVEEITGPAGLKIERDIHFEPMPLSEAESLHRAMFGG